MTNAKTPGLQDEGERKRVTFTRRQALSGPALAAGVAAITSVPVIDRVLANSGESSPRGVPEHLSLSDSGLAGDGTSDETDAINELLQRQDTIFLPSGIFKIRGTIIVPRYKHLTGIRSSSYTGRPELGARLIAEDGEHPVVVLEEGAAISQISIVGSGGVEGFGRDGISLGGRNIIDSVTVTGNRNGLDCNYTGVNRVVSCHIHGNMQHGIVNPVDSVITQNFINVNSEHGLQLSIGANDNVISQNKIEWNRGCGLNLEGTKHNVIATNIIDRNGNSGLRASDSSQAIILGNILRRNGALSKDRSDDDNHVLISGGFGAIVIGNSTETGPDDDGAGYESPKFSFVAQNQASGIAAINDLRGAVDRAVDLSTDGGSEFIVDLSYPASSASRASSTQAGEANSTLVSAKADKPATATFSGATVEEFSPGVIYNVRLLARDPADGERAVARALLVVVREAGAATATIEEITNLKGNVFGARDEESLITVRSDVARDGSKISLKLENRGRGEQQIRIWLSET